MADWKLYLIVPILGWLAWSYGKPLAQSAFLALTSRTPDNRMDVAEALRVLTDHCEGLSGARKKTGLDACKALAPLVFVKGGDVDAE